ncbi:MAG: hypothetical protein ABGX16_22070 [Pirellulales bacterium]
MVAACAKLPAIVSAQEDDRLLFDSHVPAAGAMISPIWRSAISTMAAYIWASWAPLWFVASHVLPWCFCHAGSSSGIPHWP